MYKLDKSFLLAPSHLCMHYATHNFLKCVAHAFANGVFVHTSSVVHGGISLPVFFSTLRPLFFSTLRPFRKTHRSLLDLRLTIRYTVRNNSTIDYLDD